MIFTVISLVNYELLLLLLLLELKLTYLAFDSLHLFFGYRLLLNVCALIPG